MAHVQRYHLRRFFSNSECFFWQFLLKGVYELYKRVTEAMQNEDTPTRKSGEAKIGQIILVDRSKHLKNRIRPKNINFYSLLKDIDMITPFCSPLIYEALLNEHFKINSGISIV